MGALLSKVSEADAWERMPWRAWKSPVEQAHVLPTFVLCEWAYRALALGTLEHARRTGALPLWFSAWMCGTANDCAFMALPFCDNFWQAQASVMLTPRLPLYIVEMYAVIIYSSTTAARRLRLPYAQEAALTGLLAHLLYHVYDINGPRFLWWTWHDGDPSISSRATNAPVGSSVWILTYCAIHAALYRWVSDDAFSLAGVTAALAKALAEMPQAGVRKAGERLIDAIKRLEGLHALLLRAPAVAKILFCGAVCTPLFMSAMGVAQICSLDKIGIPGPRTYRFIVAAYLVVLGKHALARGPAAAAGASTPRAFPIEDAALFKGVASFFAMHVAIGAYGNPKVHVSTGVHQKCSDSGEQTKDIMRWTRAEHMRSTGPCENSKHDYVVPPPALDGAKDGAGRLIVTPKPVEGSLDSEWYTVMGARHKDKAKERSVLALTAALGIVSYGKALGAL